MHIKESVQKLKADIPVVYLVLKDKETPFFAKLLAGITVVYALSPIDLIPDFIPVLGYLDDVIILPFFIICTIKLIPKEIWQRNQLLAIDMWKDGKPKKWYYAIPIIVIWLFVIGLIVKIIWL
ncbi:YkvA family protein [Candidatus Stoquefichus sp. SB1]|uniref:YkvA family protein n=1 Tax=Candidatus Stoquefichus sp. SB1 TaxID=1658109 RepID=UPI00067EB920|nr:DUF1232 domain-containing protein [Candidatus Stoquefichus sp. SB1]